VTFWGFFLAERIFIHNFRSFDKKNHTVAGMSAAPTASASDVLDGQQSGQGDADQPCPQTQQVSSSALASLGCCPSSGADEPEAQPLEPEPQTSASTPNPLVLCPIQTSPEARWRCIIVIDGYKAWTKSHPPIDGFPTHVDLELPVHNMYGIYQFERELKDRLLMPEYFPVRLFWYDTAWEKLLQANEVNWETCMSQLRHRVLSGQAITQGKLEHDAHLSLMNLNFDAVARFVNLFENYFVP
jgi:hypothetical protein